MSDIMSSFNEDFPFFLPPFDKLVYSLLIVVGVRLFTGD